MEPVQIPNENAQVQHVAVPLADMSAISFMHVLHQKRCCFAQFSGHSGQTEGDEWKVAGSVNPFEITAADLECERAAVKLLTARFKAEAAKLS